MSTISSVGTTATPTISRHGHGAHGVKGDKGDQTLEQLAQEGDPTAIAELKQEEQQAHPTDATKTGIAEQPKTGPTEPGKGEQIDEYV